MAYMNQERKVKLAANLKKVVPADWKYTLAVRHHSTLVLTFRELPAYVKDAFKAEGVEHFDKYGYGGINPYYIDREFKEDEAGIAAIFEAIKDAMNDGNHDRSDPMTDYFDVGWYIDIDIGKWDKPVKWV